MYDITSKNCWFKNECVKYNKNPNCECRDADIHCPKLQKMYNLYLTSGLTDKQKQPVKLMCKAGSVDYQSYCQLKEVENNIEKFVKNGGNLYIHSMNSGNGKTSWAIKLLQSYFSAIWAGSTSLECHGLFINVPRFMLDLKSSIGKPNTKIDELKENILTADLVVWDEVATKAITDYEHEQLLSMINARLDDGKSNIYTSNMGSDDIKERMGQRLYSRIVNESIDIVFNDVDHRGKRGDNSDTAASN